MSARRKIKKGDIDYEAVVYLGEQLERAVQDFIVHCNVSGSPKFQSNFMDLDKVARIYGFTERADRLNGFITEFSRLQYPSRMFHLVSAFEAMHGSRSGHSRDPFWRGQYEDVYRNLKTETKRVLQEVLAMPQYREWEVLFRGKDWFQELDL